MSKLAKLIPLLMIATLALVSAPVLAALPTPALYMCTVYEDGGLVGQGKTVEAFVGTETTARGSAVTGTNGAAALQFSVDTADLGNTLSFRVNGNAATETPNVNVSIEGLQVRLDYSAGATYTLTVTVSPSGKGTVAKNPNLAQYPAGTVVTLTASAISGWDFDHWGGAASGINPTTTVTMSSDKSVTAYFEQEAVAEGFAGWLYETFVECLED